MRKLSVLLPKVEVVALGESFTAGAHRHMLSII